MNAAALVQNVMFEKFIWTSLRIMSVAQWLTPLAPDEIEIKEKMSR